MSMARKFLADQAGATAVEYALLSSLIAMFIIAAVAALGSKTSTAYSEIGAAIK